MGFGTATSTPPRGKTARVERDGHHIDIAPATVQRAVRLSSMLQRLKILGAVDFQTDRVRPRLRIILDSSTDVPIVMNHLAHRRYRVCST